MRLLAAALTAVLLTSAGCYRFARGGVDTSKPTGTWPPNAQPLYGKDYKNNSYLQSINDAYVKAKLAEHGGNKEAVIESLRTQAWWYMNKGNYLKAMFRFNQLWLFAPDDYEVYWGESNIMCYFGKYDECEELVDRGLELKPGHYVMMASKGVIYYFRYLQDKTKYSPAEKKAHFQKADEYMTAGYRAAPEKFVTWPEWSSIKMHLEDYDMMWRIIHEGEKRGVQVLSAKGRELVNSKKKEPAVKLGLDSPTL